MRLAICIWVLMYTVTHVAPVLADEQLHMLAVSGNWAAAAHTESLTATPDVCIVFNMVSKVAFRFGDDTVEFRVTSEQWSLPTDVKGTLGLAIGQISRTYAIRGNTSSSVSVVLPEEDLGTIFSAMDKAPLMLMSVGKDKPITVSLVGSTKATNAFRTCAHIHSNAQTPGSNPFQ